MKPPPGYQALLDAICGFALHQADPQLAPFKPALRDWGDSWQATVPTQLPVSDLLADALLDCAPGARDVLHTFVEHDPLLHWEQSYRREDGLVPQRMLDGYGFAEIIGLRGPFVSDRIRTGIAVWGPHIDYPQHRHQAREAYILLSGSAQFEFAQRRPQTRSAGDVVYVGSNLVHGFRTADRSLVLCYLWQGGDLRQTSRFD